MTPRQSVGRFFVLAGAIVALAVPPLPAQAAIAGMPAPQESAQRAYLGVYIEGAAEGGGVKLGEIVAGSPAEKAGLQAGDVIVSLGDRTVGSEEDLRDAIAAYGVGQRVRIAFVRDGEKRRTSARLASSSESMEGAEGDEVEVEVKATPAREPVEVGPRGSAGQESGYLGVELSPAEDAGALVSNVVEGSPAQRAGLQSGDVIVQVGSDDVENVEGLVTAIRSHHAGDAVRLVVERGGGRKTIKATLGARGATSVGGGGAVRAVPEAVEPPSRPHAGAADLERAHQEIRELRAQLDELRRRCELQERQLETIRRALGGEREPGSTSMAAPAAIPGNTTIFGGVHPVAGEDGVWTFAAPTSGGAVAMRGAVAVTAEPAATAQEECIAVGTGATCSGEEACCTGSGGAAGTTTFAGVASGAGDACCGEGTAAIVVGDGSVTTFGAISDDAAQAQEGVFFQFAGDDDDFVPATTQKSQKVKVKAPKAVKTPKAVKPAKAPKVNVQKFKVDPHGAMHLPRFQGHPGAIELQVEGLDDVHGLPGAHAGPQGPHGQHPKVLRLPSKSMQVVTPKGAKVRSIQLAPAKQPLRVRSMPMQAPRDECNGGCPAHCGAGQVRSIALAGGQTELSCEGPCTIVFGNGQLQLIADGSASELLDDGGVAEFVVLDGDECDEECAESCSGCGGDCEDCCAAEEAESEIDFAPMIFEIEDEDHDEDHDEDEDEDEDDDSDDRRISVF